MNEKENDFRENENLKAAVERERMQRISGFFYEIPPDLLKWLREHSEKTGYGDIGERIALPKDPVLRRDLISAFSRANEAMIESRAPEKLRKTLEKTIEERKKDLRKTVSQWNDGNSMIENLRKSAAERIGNLVDRHVADLEDIRNDMDRRMLSDPLWITLIQDIEVAIRNAQLAVGTSAYEELLGHAEERREIIRD